MYFVVECTTTSAPQRQRVGERGRGERVVHADQDAASVGEFRERADIGHRRGRVADRLEPQSFAPPPIAASTAPASVGSTVRWRIPERSRTDLARPIVPP